MPVRIPATAIFNAAPDPDEAHARLHAVLRGTQPVTAWLLAGDNLRLQLHLEPRQIESHRWHRGVVINPKGVLEADWSAPNETWIPARDYVADAFDRGYDLEVWLDADECRARGLLTSSAEPTQPNHTPHAPEGEPPAAPISVRAPVQGKRKVTKGFGDEDDRIVRDVLAECGWLEKAAEQRAQFWLLSKKEAHRLSGRGKEETKAKRFRDALRRVTDY